jgi:ABC-2 type transport system ATP-binding protein
MSIAIDIQGLRKTYPRTWKSKPFEAVRGISLSVEQGEVFGFIGPNGAGKSTTIKILTGAMSASAGKAQMFGIDVGLPEARKGLGYVPENPSLPDYLTPYEILEMAIKLHGLKIENPRKHCLDWLERFELANVANKIVRGFSKGMAQRTALAHALVVQPRLLILDEPLSGLDPVGRKDMVDILAEYKKQGGTIFLTSHVLHDVERLADRFGLIHQGELKTLQSPSELAGETEMVVVRSIGENAVAGMALESAARWYGEIQRANLWQCLHDLEQAGHVIIEVRPTLTLETLFMHLIGK